MEEIIKRGLLEKKRGVYRLIQTHYEKEIEDMGLQFFIEWLAGKLELDVSQIHYQSLVLARHRLKKGKNVVAEKGGVQGDSISAKDQLLGYQQLDPASEEYKEKAKNSIKGKNI